MPRTTHSYQVAVPPGQAQDWRVERFEISPEDASRYNLHSIFAFGRYRPVRAGTYTRLVQGGQLWMSDTPAEVEDHLPAIEEIEQRGGAVLINGLGLGVVVKAALACPAVTRVDVVELSPHVAALVGPSYASDSRFRLHIADAYEMIWPKGWRWSVAWHDIWPTICGDNGPGMRRLRCKYGHRVDWQECWCEIEVRRLRRMRSRIY